MNLKTRVDKLAAQFLPPPIREPRFSAEKITLVHRLVDRWYADPERYASQLALLESCRERLEREGPRRYPRRLIPSRRARRSGRRF